MTYEEFIRKQEFISLSDAIGILLPIYVKAHVWNVDDTYEAVSKRKHVYILDILLMRNIDKGSIRGEIIDEVLFDDYGPITDKNGDEVHSINFTKSYIDKDCLFELVANELENSTSVKDDIAILCNVNTANKNDDVCADTDNQQGPMQDVDIAKADVATPVEQVSGADVEIEIEGMDLSDSKYPIIKGVKFSDLTEKQFTLIKKHYGMLRNDESKYRRAISVAAKIGLLFYERSLGTPTTRVAFLEAYRQEFDAIIKNDELAKEIYSQLPEQYRGSSSIKTGDPVDMLPIVKAAVYAGSIYDTDDVKDLGKLKKELLENNYKIPSDEVLLNIIEATKDI